VQEQYVTVHEVLCLINITEPLGRSNRVITMKKTDWMIYDYSWNDFDEDQMANHMNAFCKQGYEVFKIPDLTIRTRVDKRLNDYDNSTMHDEHSFGDGDILQHQLWTRVYYQKVSGL
jgi:hypothetical protein